MNIPTLNYFVKGEKRLILRDLMGNPVLDTGWSPNLITNFGLTRMMDTGWGGSWILGSNGTTVDVTDTSIGTFLKLMTDSTGTADVRTNSGANDYIQSHTSSKRWSAGGTGTVREFALCAQTDGTEASIHTNVTPEVVKGTDQILDFFYRMTVTPTLIDQTGTITIVDAISGNKDYDYIARPMQADYNPFIINQGFGQSTSGGAHLAYEGDIGAVTGSPSGSPDNSITPVTLSTTQAGNTGIREYRCNYGVDEANYATGLRSVGSRLAYAAGGGGGFQVQYSDQTTPTNGIIKTSNDKINMDFRVTLTRL